MTIHYEQDINFEACIEALAPHFPPTLDQRCPHCRLAIRYPIVVRERDRRMFDELMRSAQAVLDRHGVTARLLSELYTDILIAKARGDK